MRRRIEAGEEFLQDFRLDDEESAVEQGVLSRSPRRIEDEVRAVLAAGLSRTIDKVTIFRSDTDVQRVALRDGDGHEASMSAHANES
ncbi:hypothetical protein ASG40_14280 [Methylobacterium sp. Leaf399]|nr:hypothetical protein ASG40_14280 [Methylobacterium sp. Leaf399]